MLLCLSITTNLSKVTSKHHLLRRKPRSTLAQSGLAFFVLTVYQMSDRNVRNITQQCGMPVELPFLQLESARKLTGLAKNFQQTTIDFNSTYTEVSNIFNSNKFTIIMRAPKFEPKLIMDFYDEAFSTVINGHCSS